ncbi:12685_t:CDS:2 [Rhizophagus irregularis]|nr:12685_t:CDS:2 [Rhizophagus irregularis]
MTQYHTKGLIPGLNMGKTGGNGSIQYIYAGDLAVFNLPSWLQEISTRL